LALRSVSETPSTGTPRARREALFLLFLASRGRKGGGGAVSPRGGSADRANGTESTANMAAAANSPHAAPTSSSSFSFSSSPSSPSSSF